MSTAEIDEVTRRALAALIPPTIRTAGAFTLHVEAATEALPARVSIVLTGAVPDAQDELDVLRAVARGVFDSTAGHA
jgi:hypothetical protein